MQLFLLSWDRVNSTACYDASQSWTYNCKNDFHRAACSNASKDGDHETDRAHCNQNIRCDVEDGGDARRGSYS